MILKRLAPASSVVLAFAGGVSVKTLTITTVNTV